MGFAKWCLFRGVVHKYSWRMYYCNAIRSVQIIVRVMNSIMRAVLSTCHFIPIMGVGNGGAY